MQDKVEAGSSMFVRSDSLAAVMECSGYQKRSDASEPVRGAVGSRDAATQIRFVRHLDPRTGVWSLTTHRTFKNSVATQYNLRTSRLRRREER